MQNRLRSLPSLRLMGPMGDTHVCMRRRVKRQRCASQYRLQDVTQQTPPPEDARLHGAYGYIEHFSHLFVRHALEISQNHGAAENFRHASQSPLDCLLHFVRSGLFEWGAAAVLDLHRRMSLHRLRIYRSLLPVVSPQPAPVVQCFTDRDPVKPRLKRTAAAESANSAKRLQKYVLRDVGRIAGL